MSSNNCTTTIKAISTLISRGVTPAYTETNGILVINQKCIRNGVVDFSLARRTDTQKKKVSDEKILQKYDVVVNSTGVGTLGRVGQIWDLPEKITADSHVTIVRPDSTLVHPIFFGYVLKRLQPSIEAMGEGSTGQTELSREKLGAITIVLPDLDDQNEAAQLLKSIDDRITLLRETNKTLEGIAQAIFKSWFIDFDPVRAKMEGRAPAGMDEETAALFPDELVESELGLVPKGWGLCSLRDVVDIFDSKRIPLSGAERSTRKGSFPYYGAASLMDHVDDYLFDGVHLLIGEDGTVTDSHGYPVTQYVWGKFWVNNHAHILKGKSGISTEHVMLSLKRTNIQSLVTGAVQAKLSQSNMWKITFLNPTGKIAEIFGQILDPLYKRYRHNVEMERTLEGLRDTLLPRLISGRLRHIDERTGGAI